MKLLTELLDINLSYEQILDNLSEYTDDFTLQEGTVKFDDQYEFEVARDILINHYERVIDDGIDLLNDDGEGAFAISFSSPIIDDFNFPEEEVEESFELRESDETNAMLDLMQSNDELKDEPYIGSFWYDPDKDELFGVCGVVGWGVCFGG